MDYYSRGQARELTLYRNQQEVSIPSLLFYSQIWSTLQLFPATLLFTIIFCWVPSDMGLLTLIVSTISEHSSSWHHSRTTYWAWWCSYPFYLPIHVLILHLVLMNPLIDRAESSPGMKRQTCVPDITSLGDECLCNSPCQGHPNLMCITTTNDDGYCCFTPCESEIINYDEYYFCKAGNEERGDFTAGVRKIPCNPHRNTLNRP